VTPISAFAQRKGLMAVAALASAILLVGALLPGYYTWTVNYKINPLTENEKIHLPKTTGATIDQYIKIWAPLHEVIIGGGGEELTAAEKEAFLGNYSKFIAECERYVEELIANKTAWLEELNYTAPILLPWDTEFIPNVEPKKLHIDKPVYVIFQIPASDAHAVQEHYWLLIIFIGIFDQETWRLVDVDILIPSLFQVDDWKDLVSIVNLEPGKYEVVMKIFTWTGAVEDFQVPTEGSFDILIYAVEK